MFQGNLMMILFIVLKPTISVIMNLHANANGRISGRQYTDDVPTFEYQTQSIDHRLCKPA